MEKVVVKGKTYLSQELPHSIPTIVEFSVNFRAPFSLNFDPWTEEIESIWIENYQEKKELWSQIKKFPSTKLELVEDDLIFEEEKDRKEWKVYDGQVKLHQMISS